MTLAIRCTASQRCSLIAFAFAAALTAPLLAQAEDHSAVSPPPVVTEDALAVPAAGSDQAPVAQNLFSRAELEKLLAPIALYPDALLAQLLAASAYPLQIVEAQRWLDKNKAAVADKDFSWIDSRDWDPAVKAMARFPDVVEKMSDDLDWTRDLGDAEVIQPQDVADVIQELRTEAESVGVLKTSPQQTVSSVLVDDRPYIAIEPAEPSILYVPSYEPAAVYQPIVAVAPVVSFGVGIVVGAPLHRRCWNWRTGAIYPPTWAGYPGWRHGQPFWPVGGNINVGNNLKPWRPGPDYRPRRGAGVGVANSHGGASITVDRSPGGATITIRGPDGGNNAVNARPAAGAFVNTAPAGNFVSARPGGNFVSTRPGGNFVSARPGGNFVSTRPGGNFVSARPGGNFVSTRPGGNFVSARPGGNFVSTRPGGNFVSARPGGKFVSARPGGNFVNTPPAAGKFVNDRTGGIVLSHPDGMNVIKRAPGVIVAPRVAPVLPNFSLPVVPAMRSIKPGVGPIPFNRAVIGRGPASGGPVGGAMARPGGIGGGGFGGALR